MKQQAQFQNGSRKENDLKSNFQRLNENCEFL